MIYGILIGIIVLFAGLYLFSWRKLKKEERSDNVFYFMCVIILFGIYVFFFSYPTNKDKYSNEFLIEEEVVEYGDKIYSLDTESGSNVSGKFIMGCGTISTKNDAIYYYYVDKEYGKVIENRKAKETYIEESDEVEPCIKYVYTRYYTREDAPKNVERKDFKELKATILVVPKNTIQIEYNANV